MSPLDRLRGPPDPTAVERVKRRIADGDGVGPRVGLLRRLRDPDPAAVDRVHARLAAAPATRRAPGRPAWPVAAALAAAALALFVVAAPEAEVAMPLEHSAAQVGRHVAIAPDGVGRVDGAPDAPRIHWERGSVTVDVEPGAGVDLEVRTEEGTVRVLGTRFTVLRDRLGMAVHVERGHVAVACADGSAHDLRAAGRATCLPHRPAGLLDRARALTDRGAASDEVLDTLDRGLALTGDAPLDPIGDELRALRAETLFAAGMLGAAVETALDAADRPGAARRVELLRLAARAAFALDGCDAALPLVDRIAPEARVASDEVARADCLSASDRDLAAEALERAARLAHDPALRAAIAERRERLAGPSDRQDGVGHDP